MYARAKNVFSGKSNEELLFSTVFYFWFCFIIFVDRIIHDQSKKRTFNFKHL